MRANLLQTQIVGTKLRSSSMCTQIFCKHKSLQQNCIPLQCARKSSAGTNLCSKIAFLFNDLLNMTHKSFANTNRWRKIAFLVNVHTNLLQTQIFAAKLRSSSMCTQIFSGHKSLRQHCVPLQ
uniref:Uncharacterized protein n=1 Tax=viral metagenome TaxID=1070528 RepID=A0A6C0CBP0_9ZZZZ